MLAVRRDARRPLRGLRATGRRLPLLHLRARRDAGLEPDRLAPLPRRAARARRDRAPALHAPLAPPGPAVDEPEARLRGGGADLPAGDRRDDPPRRPPHPPAAARGARRRRSRCPRERGRGAVEHARARATAGADRVARVGRLSRRDPGPRRRHVVRGHGAGRLRRDRLPAVLRRCRGDPARRQPVSVRRGRHGVGRPVSLSAASRAHRDTADRAPVPGCGAPRDGVARRRRARSRSGRSTCATGAATGSRCSGRRCSRRSRRATSPSGWASPPRSRGGSATGSSLRRRASATTLAAKFFLWPLVVWQAATRRYASAALSVAIGAALLLVSWAVIGFAGMTDYPDLARTLEETVGEDSYTVYIVGLDLGLPSPVARGIWLALGLALVAAVVLVGRRGGERSAFVLAIAASLALTPIVWLHYFALLLVVVALAQPTLGRDLVRPARDGDHTRQRTSAAVRDGGDARDRGVDRRSRPSDPCPSARAHAVRLRALRVARTARAA